MGRSPCGNGMGGGEGSAGAGSPDGLEKWACPHFKYDPRRYFDCSRFKGRGAADVRQHLGRKHRQEAKKMRTEKGKKKKTNIELWNDIWDDLFPGQARPPTPYAGTGVGDVVGAWMVEYTERRGYELSADGRKALTGFLAYVHAMSRDKGARNVSDQHVGEQQVQGTHQHLLLSMNPFGWFGQTMDPFELPDPRLVPAGVWGTPPTMSTTMEPHVMPQFEADGRSGALSENSDTYPSAPAHQPPASQWVDMGFASQAVPVDLTGGMHRGWTGNS